MTTPDTPALEGAIGAALGSPVRLVGRTRLAGGDISIVERVQTTGGAFVVKSGAAPPGLFRAEAEGLQALLESGTTLRIPAVITCVDDPTPFLVIEDLGAGRQTPGFDEAFGRGLAALHRTGAPTYGFARDNFCGATPQPNPSLQRWVEFYGRARLGHQLELGTRAGLYTATDRQVLESLIDRLDHWIAEPIDGPVLIHGDLWSGNLLVADDGTPALIDPAACFAHREAELGMMTLFGGFSGRVYDAYDEALPLEPGWRDRNPLYQLYHLMNHATLFGRSYHAQVMAIARRFAG